MDKKIDRIMGETMNKTMTKNMRKRKTRFIVAAVAAAMLSVSVAAPAVVSADTYLVLGMTSDEVAQMQQALINLGYLQPPADGYFGPATKIAVSVFQSDMGLYVDGEAGPQTLDAIFALNGYVPEAQAVQDDTQDDADVPGDSDADVQDQTTDQDDASAADSSSVNSQTYLMIGSTGEAVAAVQQKLKDLGYLYALVDGDYGNYTAEAVRAYQRDHGLYADGEAGPLTLAVLMPANPAPSQAVSQSSSSSSSSEAPFDFSSVYLMVGSKGSEVKIVQQKLKDLGYLYALVDGDYGSYTAEAVRQFQADHGLYADGEAGPLTLAKMFGGQAHGSSTSPSAPTVLASAPFDYSTTYLRIGSQGDEVKFVQRVLTDLGYLDSVIDGDYGRVTADAVRAYQVDKGIYDDGEAGPVTLVYLLRDSGYAGETGEGTTYQIGSNSDQVLVMQSKLAELGYLTTTPDGFYGESTAAAVKCFQYMHGDVVADGVATPAVYDRIMQETSSFFVINANSSYNAVIGLQRALEENRLVGVIDGSYGDATREAVLQIQKLFNLPQTGVVDARTMYHILTYSNHVNNTSDVQGYHSDTEWLLYVNTTTNRLYVYKGSIWNWKEVYNWGCSTGADETPTCLGEYTVGDRGYSFGSGYTCYYFTSFNGPYLFHSTLFDEGTFRNYDSRLGLNLSHGCVRLDVNNAKWIYNNIPVGTKVVVVK